MKIADLYHKNHQINYMNDVADWLIMKSDTKNLDRVVLTHSTKAINNKWTGTYTVCNLDSN